MKRRGECLWVVAIEAQRDIYGFHHDLDGTWKQCYLVQPGHSHVDIQYVCAGLHLRDSFLAHALQVTCLQCSRQFLLAGGIDTLADQHSGAIASDRDLPCSAGYSGLH